MYGTMHYNDLQPKASLWEKLADKLRNFLLCCGIISLGLLAGMTL